MEQLQRRNLGALGKVPLRLIALTFGGISFFNIWCVCECVHVCSHVCGAYINVCTEVY